MGTSCLHRAALALLLLTALGGIAGKWVYSASIGLVSRARCECVRVLFPPPWQHPCGTSS